MKINYSKYFLLLLTLIAESCFFGLGSPTFKDSDNYILTGSMVIQNTHQKEKITAIKIYVDTVSLFTGRNLILDTTFIRPVDNYQIPFSKNSLNSTYVSIFITLSRPPGLSLSTAPGDLTKKNKILFEGDKY